MNISQLAGTAQCSSVRYTSLCPCVIGATMGLAIGVSCHLTHLSHGRSRVLRMILSGFELGGLWEMQYCIRLTGKIWIYMRSHDCFLHQRTGFWLLPCLTYNRPFLTGRVLHTSWPICTKRQSKISAVSSSIRSRLSCSTSFTNAGAHRAVNKAELVSFEVKVGLNPVSLLCSDHNSFRDASRGDAQIL